MARNISNLKFFRHSAAEQAEWWGLSYHFLQHGESILDFVLSSVGMLLPVVPHKRFPRCFVSDTNALDKDMIKKSKSNVIEALDDVVETVDVVKHEFDDVKSIDDIKAIATAVLSDIDLVKETMKKNAEYADEVYGQDNAYSRLVGSEYEAALDECKSLLKGVLGAKDKFEMLLAGVDARNALRLLMFVKMRLSSDIPPAYVSKSCGPLEVLAAYHNETLPVADDAEQQQPESVPSTQGGKVSDLELLNIMADNRARIKELTQLRQPLSVRANRLTTEKVNEYTQLARDFSAPFSRIGDQFKALASVKVDDYHAIDVLESFCAKFFLSLTQFRSRGLLLALTGYYTDEYSVYVSDIIKSVMQYLIDECDHVAKTSGMPEGAKTAVRNIQKEIVKFAELVMEKGRGSVKGRASATENLVDAAAAYIQPSDQAALNTMMTEPVVSGGSIREAVISILPAKQSKYIPDAVELNMSFLEDIHLALKHFGDLNYQRYLSISKPIASKEYEHLTGLAISDDIARAKKDLENIKARLEAVKNEQRDYDANSALELNYPIAVYYEIPNAQADAVVGKPISKVFFYRPHDISDTPGFDTTEYGMRDIRRHGDSDIADVFPKSRDAGKPISGAMLANCIANYQRFFELYYRSYICIVEAAGLVDRYCRQYTHDVRLNDVDKTNLRKLIESTVTHSADFNTSDDLYRALLEVFDPSNYFRPAKDYGRDLSLYNLNDDIPINATDAKNVPRHYLTGDLNPEIDMIFNRIPSQETPANVFTSGHIATDGNDTTISSRSKTMLYEHAKPSDRKAGDKLTYVAQFNKQIIMMKNIVTLFVEFLAKSKSANISREDALALDKAIMDWMSFGMYKVSWTLPAIQPPVVADKINKALKATVFNPEGTALNVLDTNVRIGLVTVNDVDVTAFPECENTIHAKGHSTFTTVVKAMVGLIMNVLGVYDMKDARSRPYKVNVLSDVRLTLGAAPSLALPDAFTRAAIDSFEAEDAELYFRLPCFVEFYRRFFNLKSKSPSTTSEITIIPDVGIPFNKLFSYMLKHRSDQSVFRYSKGEWSEVIAMVSDIARFYKDEAKKANYPLLEFCCLKLRDRVNQFFGILDKHEFASYIDASLEMNTIRNQELISYSEVFDTTFDDIYDQFDSSKRDQTERPWDAIAEAGLNMTEQGYKSSFLQPTNPYGENSGFKSLSVARNYAIIRNFKRKLYHLLLEPTHEKEFIAAYATARNMFTLNTRLKEFSTLVAQKRSPEEQFNEFFQLINNTTATFNKLSSFKYVALYDFVVNTNTAVNEVLSFVYRLKNRFSNHIFGKTLDTSDLTVVRYNVDNVPNRIISGMYSKEYSPLAMIGTLPGTSNLFMLGMTDVESAFNLADEAVFNKDYKLRLRDGRPISYMSSDREMNPPTLASESPGTDLEEWYANNTFGIGDMLLQEDVESSLLDESINGYIAQTRRFVKRQFGGVTHLMHAILSMKADDVKCDVDNGDDKTKFVKHILQVDDLSRYGYNHIFKNLMQRNNVGSLGGRFNSHAFEFTNTELSAPEGSVVVPISRSSRLKLEKYYNHYMVREQYSAMIKQDCFKLLRKLLAHPNLFRVTPVGNGKFSVDFNTTYDKVHRAHNATIRLLSQFKIFEFDPKITEAMTKILTETEKRITAVFNKNMSLPSAQVGDHIDEARQNIEAFLSLEKSHLEKHVRSVVDKMKLDEDVVSYALIAIHAGIKKYYASDYPSSSSHESQQRTDPSTSTAPRSSSSPQIVAEEPSVNNSRSEVSGNGRVVGRAKPVDNNTYGKIKIKIGENNEYVVEYKFLEHFVQLRDNAVDTIVQHLTHNMLNVANEFWANYGMRYRKIKMDPNEHIENVTHEHSNVGGKADYIDAPVLNFYRFVNTLSRSEDSTKPKEDLPFLINFFMEETSAQPGMAAKSGAKTMDASSLVYVEPVPEAFGTNGCFSYDILSYFNNIVSVFIKGCYSQKHKQVYHRCVEFLTGELETIGDIDNTIPNISSVRYLPHGINFSDHLKTEGIPAGGLFERQNPGNYFNIYNPYYFDHVSMFLSEGVRVNIKPTTNDTTYVDIEGFEDLYGSKFRSYHKYNRENGYGYYGAVNSLVKQVSLPRAFTIMMTTNIDSLNSKLLQQLTTSLSQNPSIKELCVYYEMLDYMQSNRIDPDQISKPREPEIYNSLTDNMLMMIPSKEAIDTSMPSQLIEELISRSMLIWSAHRRCWMPDTLKNMFGSMPIVPAVIDAGSSTPQYYLQGHYSDIARGRPGLKNRADQVIGIDWNPLGLFSKLVNKTYKNIIDDIRSPYFTHTFRRDQTAELNITTYPFVPTTNKYPNFGFIVNTIRTKPINGRTNLRSASEEFENYYSDLNLSDINLLDITLINYAEYDSVARRNLESPAGPCIVPFPITSLDDIVNNGLSLHAAMYPNRLSSRDKDPWSILQTNELYQKHNRLFGIALGSLLNPRVMIGGEEMDRDLHLDHNYLSVTLRNINNTGMGEHQPILLKSLKTVVRAISSTMLMAQGIEKSGTIGQNFGSAIMQLKTIEPEAQKAMLGACMYAKHHLMLLKNYCEYLLNIYNKLDLVKPVLYPNSLQRINDLAFRFENTVHAIEKELLATDNQVNLGMTTSIYGGSSSSLSEDVDPNSTITANLFNFMSDGARYPVLTASIKNNTDKKVSLLSKHYAENNVALQTNTIKSDNDRSLSNARIKNVLELCWDMTNSVFYSSLSPLGYCNKFAPNYSNVFNGVNDDNLSFVNVAGRKSFVKRVREFVGNDEVEYKNFNDDMKKIAKYYIDENEKRESTNRVGPNQNVLFPESIDLTAMTINTPAGKTVAEFVEGILGIDSSNAGEDYDILANVRNKFKEAYDKLKGELQSSVLKNINVTLNDPQRSNKLLGLFVRYMYQVYDDKRIVQLNPVNAITLGNLDTRIKRLYDSLLEDESKDGYDKHKREYVYNVTGGARTTLSHATAGDKTGKDKLFKNSFIPMQYDKHDLYSQLRKTATVYALVNITQEINALFKKIDDNDNTGIGNVFDLEKINEKLTKIKNNNALYNDKKDIVDKIMKYRDMLEKGIGGEEYIGYESLLERYPCYGPSGAVYSFSLSDDDMSMRLLSIGVKKHANPWHLRYNSYSEVYLSNYAFYKEYLARLKGAHSERTNYPDLGGDILNKIKYMSNVVTTVNESNKALEGRNYVNRDAINEVISSLIDIKITPDESPFYLRISAENYTIKTDTTKISISNLDGTAVRHDNPVVIFDSARQSLLGVIHPRGVINGDKSAFEFDYFNMSANSLGLYSRNDVLPVDNTSRFVTFIDRLIGPLLNIDDFESTEIISHVGSKYTEDYLLRLNILDLNIMPIDVNVLDREVPLVHLHNYAHAFDEYFMGITEGTYIEPGIIGTALATDNSGFYEGLSELHNEIAKVLSKPGSSGTELPKDFVTIMARTKNVLISKLRAKKSFAEDQTVNILLYKTMQYNTLTTLFDNFFVATHVRPDDNRLSLMVQQNVKPRIAFPSERFEWDKKMLWVDDIHTAVVKYSNAETAVDMFRTPMEVRLISDSTRPDFLGFMFKDNVHRTAPFNSLFSVAQLVSANDYPTSMTSFSKLELVQHLNDKFVSKALRFAGTKIDTSIFGLDVATSPYKAFWTESMYKLNNTLDRPAGFVGGLQLAMLKPTAIVSNQDGDTAREMHVMSKLLYTEQGFNYTLIRQIFASNVLYNFLRYVIAVKVTEAKGQRKVGIENLAPAPFNRHRQLKL